MTAIDFPDSPTVGQVFDKWTWNGTVWALTATPTARVVQTGISLANNTVAKFSFSSTAYDNAGLYNGTALGFTIPAGMAGLWQFSAVMGFPGTTANTLRWTQVQKNGAGFVGSTVATSTATVANGVGTNLSDDIVLAAGDTLTLHGFQDSGGPITVDATFSVRRIGPTP